MKLSEEGSASEAHEIEATLVKNALRGGARARASLVSYLTPELQRRARWYLGRQPRARGDYAEVDDLVNTTWLRLLERDQRLLRAYDPRRGMGLPSYAELLLRRELFRDRRRGRSVKRGAGADHSEFEDSVLWGDWLVDDAQRRVELVKHLEQTLPARSRAVFEAMYVRHLSVAETATELRMARQCVYNHRHKIRAEARAFWGTR